MTPLRCCIQTASNVSIPHSGGNGGDYYAGGKYKAISMPVDGNNCFWHALVIIANGEAGSNTHTVKSLKELYRSTAHNYMELFIPILFEADEYPRVVEQSVRDRYY